jgi:hypothetical protein
LPLAQGFVQFCTAQALFGPLAARSSIDDSFGKAATIRQWGAGAAARAVPAAWAAFAAVTAKADAHAIAVAATAAASMREVLLTAVAFLFALRAS